MGCCKVLESCCECSRGVGLSDVLPVPDVMERVEVRPIVQSDDGCDMRPCCGNDKAVE
ncbi:hypothetical protein [Neisseria animalis]|uniref:hypothetical protein n=1 Tax=Neisseria animalis TaxID=492 RepID=UPI0013BE9D72|nr:hypothetical protein [Neisseria animalis]